MKRCILLLSVLACAACGPAAPSGPNPASPATPEAPAPAPAVATPGAAAPVDLDTRLAYLSAELEEARAAQHVPGMAVAVVKDDRVVFARGFGERDLETGEAVTAETLFAIGSSTKAFTATAAGMVVDDGELSWDDPLSRHVPGLRLQVKAEAGEEATVRDALSHRTGFPRMGLLWGSGALSRDEIFQYASRAEPTRGLREAFQYNNVVFTGAGEASARAAGTSWAELVRTRILAPLGMERTYLSAPEAETTGMLATGYTWFDDIGEHQRENLRDIRSVAPAGSIHSSVLDMARWVRFQLAGGAVDGKRLIQEATLAETRKVQIAIEGLGGYGLGWFVREWNGQPFIEHGGNIDGFSASVGLLPEAGVGYVLLSNTTASALQAQVGAIVFDALLGDIRQEQEGTGEDFTPYLGAYVATFGPFDDDRFEVSLKDGKMALEVPGQGVFGLGPADEQGRRPLEIPQDVKVSFARDDSGKVVGMQVHQHGMVFELPREGVDIPLQVDMDRVAPYLGKYENAEKKSVVTVRIYRGRLAVDVPGQPTLSMDAPAPPDDDEWRLRIKREYYVTFQQGPRGQVQGLTIHQGDQGDVAYTRLPDQEAPVTLERVVALRKPEQRRRALAAIGHTVIEGKVRFPQSGIEGTFSAHFHGPDRYRQEVNLGKAGRIIQVASGDSAWIDSSFDDAEQLRGLRLRQARAQHPMAFVGDWRAFFDSVELAGSEAVEGKTAHVVRLRAGELPAARAYVDPATGDVLRVAGFEVQHFGKIPASSQLEDYRPVRGARGLRVPRRIIAEVFQSGRMIVTIDRVRTRLKPAPELFPAALPATGQ